MSISPDLLIRQDADAVASAISTMTATVHGVAAATASAVAAAAASPNDDDSQGECRLLGPFALFIQVALGGLALLSLVYKRWKERPQRPVKIWFFDVSKQVNGSILVHIVNVFMSMLTSGRFSIKTETPAVAAAMMMVKRATGGDDDYSPNPCSFYLLNLGIDTTIGIPILIILLRVTTALFAMTRYGQPPESIQSGFYGNPPNVWWWIKQSIIYFIGLLGMKVCVLIIFVMIPGIAKVGDWALGWTEGNEKLQIAFSMMIFPLIMNALQYYIIDSFIKKKETDHEILPSQDPDSAYDDETALLSSDDEDEDGNHRTRRRSTGTVSDDEYEMDGESGSRPAAGSSSNQRGVPGRVPKELYPKE
ncbi:vacuolar membrane protein-domain-containing protein [Stachybotrys elegans]|uniref:Vacuolar membrane protein-domain-containing protein n=1 Tax=Stachybotrys elegans TaxID=80388 RepID=A0A8K0WXT5_9HYPO|nr:vacuolar membrane protein-domain-containing protein [Stachybotrys elegans]